MKNDRPILFSTPMVQAILRGEKRVTRRATGALNPGIEFWEDLAPFYPGQVLWVKETWQEVPTGDTSKSTIFRADGHADYKWRPSLFMPKRVARIFLRVKFVSIERLQDITEEEAGAEGFQSREQFRLLWDSLNEKRGIGWQCNPYVYRIEFDIIKGEVYEKNET